MRFLFATHSPVFGGPHNQAVQLSVPLARRGWETVVLLPDESGNAAQRLRASGVEVVQIPLWRLRARPDPFLQLRFALGFYGGVAQIRRLIRESGIDLVVVGGLINPHVAIAARLERIPVVWQLLDTRAPAVLRATLMLLVQRLADVILSTGVEVAARHSKALAFGDRLIPFYPPVDVGHFQFSQVRRVASRAELGLRRDELVIGNVSNLNRQKGHDTFVAAAVHIRRRFPQVRFLILGASYEHHASYMSALWNKAEKQGLRLGQELIVRDPGSRVAELACAIDIFWMTSGPRSEGIPTVVEEAMALELPVVTTDVGSVREAVDDGVTGFVTPPRRPQTIADVTYPLLADASLRKRIGEAARQWAVEHCDIEHCADTHVRAFDMAMQHHGDGRGGLHRSAALR